MYACAQRIHAGAGQCIAIPWLFLSQMSPNFLLWLVLGVFLMATSLRMYATCQQLQAQAQALCMYHQQRGRLQSLRLQLTLLEHEFGDLGYDALRALDADSSPRILLL